MDSQEAYFFFCITLIIVEIFSRWYSNKRYPDKKDWEHKRRLRDGITFTYLFVSLYWFLVSYLLGFIELF